MAKSKLIPIPKFEEYYALTADKKHVVSVKRTIVDKNGLHRTLPQRTLKPHDKGVVSPIYRLSKNGFTSVVCLDDLVNLVSKNPTVEMSEFKHTVPTVIYKGR